MTIQTVSLWLRYALATVFAVGAIAIVVLKLLTLAVLALFCWLLLVTVLSVLAALCVISHPPAQRWCYRCEQLVPYDESILTAQGVRCRSEAQCHANQVGHS